ncbi:MAG: peptidoglycan DD-metalloendopeptidase family protein [Smithellaceae bacterium]
MIEKKTGLALLIILLMGIFPVYQIFTQTSPSKEAAQDVAPAAAFKSIESSIEPGETLFAIFQKHGLSIDDLFAMKQAAASVHHLRQIHPGQPYSFIVDENNCINAFTYGINENTTLKIERGDQGFSAQKCEVPFESRLLTIGGQIEGSLIAALGQEREEITLAIQVSDIMAWDIDFNTDLRTGDTFRVIVEGLYLNGEFKRYGKILAVEFVNDHRTHVAYRFEHNGKADYFDAEGKSLRKAFLKAPLSFRRISSSFSRSRRHPILKINRPHHGIDYVAPTGTPVSATADGRISFIGFKGGYGKLIILSHRNGLQTYYGHLSRFASGMRSGKQVQQGDLVGFVGSTGISTGPHLHYEMRQNGAPINPTRFKPVAGAPVAASRMNDFRQITATFNQTFAQSIFYETKDAQSRETARTLAMRFEEANLFN